MDQRPWHVLQVVTNHEKKVANHLAVRSLEHYLPLYTERSNWTDRRVILERPLFLGYVFVRFEPQSRKAALSVPGVLRLLGGSHGEMVSSEELERIREGLAKGCILRPHPNVSVGTPVRVQKGVFEGAEGVVMEFRRSCRVVISISALNQSFSLELAPEDVQVIPESHRRREVHKQASFRCISGM